MSTKADATRKRKNAPFVDTMFQQDDDDSEDPTTDGKVPNTTAKHTTNTTSKGTKGSEGIAATKATSEKKGGDVKAKTKSKSRSKKVTSVKLATVNAYQDESRMTRIFEVIFVTPIMEVGVDQKVNSEDTIKLHTWLRTAQQCVRQECKSIDEYIHALSSIAKVCVNWTNDGILGFIREYPADSGALLDMNWTTRFCRVIEKLPPKPGSYVAALSSKNKKKSAADSSSASGSVSGSGSANSSSRLEWTKEHQTRVIQELFPEKQKGLEKAKVCKHCGEEIRFVDVQLTHEDTKTLRICKCT